MIFSLLPYFSLHISLHTKTICIFQRHSGKKPNILLKYCKERYFTEHNLTLPQYRSNFCSHFGSYYENYTQAVIKYISQ